MTVRMVWPPRAGTRLIPAAANSITLTVSRNSNVLTTKVVARPPGGGVSTIKVDQIPAGDVVIDASANPDAGGTGVAQAAGRANVKIERDKDTKFTITMDSTIDRVEVTSAAGEIVQLGGSLQLTATPRDAQGSVVLVTPGSITWASSDDTVAPVDSAGQVSGVKGGSVTITVTEPESGKTGTKGVTVGGSLYVLYIPGYYYQGEQYWMTNANADFYLDGTLVVTTKNSTPHDGLWIGPWITAGPGHTIRVSITPREPGQKLEFGYLWIGLMDATYRIVQRQQIRDEWYTSDAGAGLDFSFAIPF